MTKDPYFEGRVLSADPVELIRIVYEHALDMVSDARRFLAAGDISARSNAICRALAALSELDGSLDHAHGGDISSNLAQLYQYMRTRLTLANIHQTDAPLAEVEALLGTLGEAWKAIAAKPADEPSVPAAVKPAALANWGPFATETQMQYSGHGWSA
jgi:flagellar protein FliS